VLCEDVAQACSTYGRNDGSRGTPPCWRCVNKLARGGLSEAWRHAEWHGNGTPSCWHHQQVSYRYSPPARACTQLFNDWVWSSCDRLCAIAALADLSLSPLAPRPSLAVSHSFISVLLHARSISVIRSVTPAVHFCCIAL